MAILSFNGRIGVGKDTAGAITQYLLHSEGIWDAKVFQEYTKSKNKSHWQHYWEIKKFAGKLKQIATLLTGVPIEKWEDQEFKKTYMSDDWCYTKQVMECDENNQDGFMELPFTHREFLQKLGTEAVRDGLHPNTWVNALFADYKQNRRKTDDEEYVTEYPNWIITDMRFPNEFEAVKKREGICIKVERFDKSDTRKFNEVPNWNHPSETALDSFTFDYVINNSGTIEDLVVEVQKMLKYFKLIP